MLGLAVDGKAGMGGVAGSSLVWTHGGIEEGVWGSGYGSLGGVLAASVVEAMEARCRRCCISGMADAVDACETVEELGFEELNRTKERKKWEWAGGQWLPHLSR